LYNSCNSARYGESLSVYLDGLFYWGYASQAVKFLLREGTAKIYTVYFVKSLKSHDAVGVQSRNLIDMNMQNIIGITWLRYVQRPDAIVVTISFEKLEKR
jgi:hypothetical protein